MDITFISLAESHFPLLLKWLQEPHVKAWWDQDVKWTRELIIQKYTDCVKGCRLENGADKPISAYVAYADETPIGYIQYYNVHDFQREDALPALPLKCASFDWYMGEEEYIGKGIGTKVLELFINDYIFEKFTAIFVDSDKKNLAAIKVYEKIGFALLQPKDWYFKNHSIVPMLKYKHPLRLSMHDRVAIEVLFRKYFAGTDSLWVFGSRVDMTRKGGDIDLYIETNIKDTKEAMDKRSKFWGDLQRELGEQKIDIVLNTISDKYDLPIHEVARSEGLKIV